MTMSNIIDGGWTQPPRKTTGGEPPMSTLEKRVYHLESQVSVIDTKIDNITENYATKADLSKTTTDIIKWNLITSIGLIGAVFTVLRYIAP